MSEPGDDDPKGGPSNDMRPERWFGEPNVCGSCIAWRAEDPREGETVAAGICRLRKELSRVPATLRKCDLYKPRGKFVYTPSPAKPEPKRRKRASAVRVMRRDEASGELVTTEAPRPARSSAPRERPPVPREVDVGADERGLVRALLKEILAAQTPDAGRELHGRFEGGTVRIVAADGKTRQVPVERLFRLLEAFRTSLEALEDQVVGKDPLLDQFVELNKQLRAIHGTMTTFNFLYADRAHYFNSKG